MGAGEPIRRRGRTHLGSREALSSALSQLRLKLLDLTARNRLLNFKHPIGRSLQFVEGEPENIYQKLVESTNRATIAILSLPEPEKRDWIERNGRLQRPEAKEWAKAQGVSVNYDLPDPEADGVNSSLRALMYRDDLAKHCRKIEREAHLAIEETGANMLFLVLGFLEFPDQRDSDKKFTAPLINVPVIFQKREAAGIQSYSLQFTGDDISENLSLREKLKNDFGLILPEMDDEQIDVSGYFKATRSLIAKQPGFVFRRRVSLCLLSFSNMLLVKDLDPSKWPQNGDANGLIDHPIVREVFEGSSDESAPGIQIAVEHEVEKEPGATIPLVYDADSSQHSALIDVLSLKKNLVIEGPPGTGKSQTITNLIAACLAQGKSVLFVAEKLAALEVVKNRLTMAGLDAFVLELHSNKTNKKRVLEEIAKRIDFNPQYGSGLLPLQKQLESHRNELKGYSDLINSVTHNAFGLTLHEVMWRAEKHRRACGGYEALLSQVTIPDCAQISEFELARRMECLGHLSEQYTSIGGFSPEGTFWGFFLDQLVPGDEVRIANLFREAITWAETLEADSSRLSVALCEAVKDLNGESAEAQAIVLERFLANVPRDLPLHLIRAFCESDGTAQRARQILTHFHAQLRRYHDIASTVGCALVTKAPVAESRVSELKSLARSAESLGVELGDVTNIRALFHFITEALQSFRSAMEVVNGFGAARNIRFDGTRHNLVNLRRLAGLIVDIPESYLHLQRPALAQEGAVRAIEGLVAKQTDWVDIQSNLAEKLYIDMLPTMESIADAVLILRQGDAWFRIFQSRWRAAVALHRSIQRIKRKIAVEDRLVQLELVVKLQNVKEQLETDPAWAQFLGCSGSVDSSTLEGYLAVARWNHTVKCVSEETQTHLIDPITITAEQARVLRREISPYINALDLALEGLGGIEAKLTHLRKIPGCLQVKTAIDIARDFAFRLESQIEWLESQARHQAGFEEVLKSCEAALESAKLRTLIENNEEAKYLLGGLYKGVDSDPSHALEVLNLGESIDALDLSTSIKAKLKTTDLVESAQLIGNLLRRVSVGFRCIERLATGLNQYGEFDPYVSVGSRPENDLSRFSQALLGFIKKAAAGTDLLMPWSLYMTRRREADDLKLSEFTSLLEDKRMTPERLADAYAFATYSSIVRGAFRSIPQLGKFTGLKHNQICEEFRRLDKEIIYQRGRAIGYECNRKAAPPYGRNGARVDDKSEMVLLNYLVPQQRPRMPLRKMLMRARVSVQTLKPCFMMGPQAVAQYLTPGAIKFDLVIMDEASQLRPEEAIGAIARGGQLVVVGDPKQLPPTSFFSRMNQSADDDEQFTTTDAESILDVCASHFRPIRSLRWHYRSQHHSLIAFSNHNFYRDHLIIFPSPYGRGGRLGVRAVYLADAVYDNQLNIREAKRVVDAVVEHIASQPQESLGIVTLNIKQRDLIAELLEERLKYVTGADAYRDYWVKEGQPMFIKNLENVQGDERDAIFISTTFGKPPGSNVVRQNFGPISRQGGWRRLNVLFTRAKRSVVVYTSMRPEDIVLDGTTQEGTKALRNYLEFARTGSLTVSEESGREPDSDFEISVMEMLRSHGYEVTPQLGVAGFRIDIAVKHPDAPGIYLAAIECDGASYHSALSVRDRDRIRQEILESLGWRGRIWRIWSTDWFRRPDVEGAKLISYLEGLRESWKPDYSSGEAWIEEGYRGEDQSEQESESAISALIDTQDDLEVNVGDVVKYVDLQQAENILTVQVTGGREDPAKGVLHKSRPIAQTLLGAVIGDEVTLKLPGSNPRTFKILGIEREPH